MQNVIGLKPSVSQKPKWKKKQLTERDERLSFHQVHDSIEENQFGWNEERKEKSALLHFDNHIFSFNETHLNVAKMALYLKITFESKFFFLYLFSGRIWGIYWLFNQQQQKIFRASHNCHKLHISLSHCVKLYLLSSMMPMVFHIKNGTKKRITFDCMVVFR